MAERQFGPYRLVRQIAVGGMAEIHLAKTMGIAGFEKYVALKMIHPNYAEDDQFIQMLVDEAKIAVQLSHGNIAQTFDLGRVGDTFYITMEFVDGADMYKILRRASEMDIEMPFDVCAFIGKEMASALDHAHRKKDHTGRSLGIVHRDVSPQNVLVSYAGEVKLVDFGIAKATMKAKQTAAGVIKGKYYYMSPEQAWGDTIDYRSDIFSAGIVLYETIVGQMLYLEEDLHRLLDMVRRADIKPPSTLRKGVPPQLEKIVMRALSKAPGDRYPSAADFATDLERFMHAHSPGFTAAKVAQLVKHILGEPEDIPEYTFEVRDGQIGTLNPEELVHGKEEIRDENSVIFRVAELRPKQPERKAPAPSQPPIAGRIPARVPSKPRDPHEQTRQVQPSPWDGEATRDISGDADSVEHTLITAPNAGFVVENAAEDGGEATMISSGPPVVEPDTDASGTALPEDAATLTERAAHDEETITAEDGPTIQRDPFRAKQAAKRGPPPAALAANIHAPAVSELRKPRASRRTPGAGTPVPNVLQAIVGSQPAESMPEPPRPKRTEDSAVETLPQRPSPVAGRNAPGPQPPLPLAPPPAQPYNGAPYDASGLPIAPMTTPPQGSPYAPQPQAPYGYPQNPQQGVPFVHLYDPTTPSRGTPNVSPGSLYPNPMQPFGAAPQPMSLTGQLRLFEADEIPAKYKVSRGGRWVVLAIAGAIAITVAGSVTFFIIKATRDTTPTVGSIHVESNPPGAEVSYDGTRLSSPTPVTIDSVPVGTRHEIKVQYPRHKAYVETVDIPKSGEEVPVSALLKPITGKLVVDTVPGGAEVYINGQPRGHTPTTITDIDMDSAKRVELRLKGYQDYAQELSWPANGEIDIEQKLQH